MKCFYQLLVKCWNRVQHQEAPQCILLDFLSETFSGEKHQKPRPHAYLGKLSLVQMPDEGPKNFIAFRHL